MRRMLNIVGARRAGSESSVTESSPRSPRQAARTSIRKTNWARKRCGTGLGRKSRLRSQPCDCSRPPRWTYSSGSVVKYKG